MQLRRTTLAIPCDSLADISPDLAEADAGNLLALWTALWDPVLVAQTRQIPAARRLDAVVEEQRDAGELVVIPAVSRSDTPDDWQADSPLVLRHFTFASRRQVISQLQERLGTQPLGTPAAADFYALGFAYLQVEQLTRSMHYDPLVKQESLREAVVAAADAALAGDEASLAAHLTDAYDHLMQSRNHYYPVDFYLIDLTLTAPGVAGPSLAEACREAARSSVMVTGEFIEHLAVEHPESLAAMREAWQGDRLTVCGGSMTERPLETLGPETLLRELTDGQAACERHLGRRLAVFAHPAGPMAPLVPGVLYRLGYHAAVLANFRGAAMPANSSSRTTWTGLDNTPIEALAAVPIDSGSHAAMLGLWRKIQRAMNYDLAASLLLAGWPGHRTEWHGDLMHIARRSSLLGRPVTLEEYFDSTTSHDYSGTTPVEAYPDCAASPGAESPDFSQRADRSLAALAQIAGVARSEADDGATAMAALLGSTGGTRDEGTLWLNTTSLPDERQGGTLPAFGWLWQPAASPGSHPPRCEPGILRNEQLQVVFDELTGGISATRLHAQRGNHLSQQLVLRPIGPQGIAAGMQLAMDGWEVIESSATLGTLATNYRIVDRDAKTLAHVRQLSTLAEHARQVDLRVHFELLDERAERCQVISRIAIRDEDFSMTRGLQGVDLPTSRSTVTSRWLGITGVRLPMVVACDTARQHRRHSGRMLDTTLLEPGGKTMSAALSYVLDGDYPAQVFARWCEPPLITSVAATAVRQSSGWWLHIGAKNLMVTHLTAQPLATEPLATEPLATEPLENGSLANGPVNGDLVVRMRLLETAGRAVNTQLAAWRPIIDARMLNFIGEPDQLLSVSDGVARLSLAPYEFAEVEFAIGGTA